MKRSIILLMCICLLFVSGCKIKVISVDNQSIQVITEMCKDKGGWDAFYVYNIVMSDSEVDVYCNDGTKITMSVDQLNRRTDRL